VNDQMQAGMADATRLTREGRLEGATALIRRTLRGAFVPAADTGDGPREPIEAPSRVENEASHPTAPDPTRPALRRAPKPSGKASRRFRGLSRLPGTAPGAVPDFCPPPVVPTGGRFVERSYTNRAGTRDYKLYIPSGYVGQEVSLIVMLHGCTQDPDDFAAGARMNALAEEHTFLVAYPAQAASANTSRCWNWFKPGDQRRGQGEPSIIAGITCEVVGEYHVDPGRVYVAGMSAGGAMAAIMGATYPDLYAAIGVHSGLAPGAAHDLSSALAAMRHAGLAAARRDTPAGELTPIVPAIAFHGDRDTTVHPRNADRLLEPWVVANTASSREVAGGPASLATVHMGQVSGGYAYTRAIHHDGGARATMEQWTVHGLGHAWSGGSLPDSYTDPKGPDASAEMVKFFQQHPQLRLTDD
jgi:poly(hydroxyalkanoate) depolymerase family esterase